MFKEFSPQSRESLEMIPSLEEVRQAMWSRDPNKVPRYDGFNIRFIKEIQDIIGTDVIDFVRSFFLIGEFPSSINTTWVTLIPKKTNPCSIKEFRPISVVGSFYMIISKIIANSLKLVIGEVVSENQSGFIQGRYIFYGILTANEAMQCLKEER